MGLKIKKLVNYKINKQWIFWWIILFINIFILNLLKIKFNLATANNIAATIGIFILVFNLFLCARSINYNLKQKGILTFPKIVNLLFAFTAVVFVITTIILIIVDSRSFWLWK